LARKIRAGSAEEPQARAGETRAAKGFFRRRPAKGLFGSGDARCAPIPDVVGIEGDAEEIRGDEAELRGAERDDADNHAVRAGNHPALPNFPTDEDGRKDREDTRDIVQPKHVHVT